AGDLARLLRRFEAQLDDGRLVDPPGLLALARGAALDGPVRAPLGLPLLILDVTPTSPAQAALLAAVAGRAPAWLATAPTGDDEGIGYLESLGARAGALDVDAEDRRQDSRLGRLRRRVFQEQRFRDQDDDPAPLGSEDWAGDDGDDDRSLDVFSAPGEGRECVDIARRLHEAARKGIPFDRCAIALRDPELYFPLLEEALERAKIPAHFTRGTRRPDPAGRAFLALLACASERLSARRFAEYLSLGQVPDADAEGAPPEVTEVPWVAPEGDQLVLFSLEPMPGEPAESEPRAEAADVGTPDADAPVVAGSLRAPRQWERLLVDAAVIEGRDRWQRRLAGAEAELRLRLRGLGDDGGDGSRKSLERRLGQLKTLERFALPLVDDLARLPESATWGRWLEDLERLAARALRRPERVLETLAELRPMAEVGPVPLEEVRRVLEDRLATLRTEPRRRRHGRVLVATLDELRGRSVDILFLPGLAEGMFPRRLSEDPLLLDALRARVDPALPGRRRRRGRERLLLRLAAGAPRRRLVVSYPNLDVLTGRSRVPSFYALDLLRAADGALPDVRAFERRASERSGARLGWPAPRQADRAIDDAEYDLATLAELLTRPAEEVTGEGRFLLDTNDHLRRALRNRYVRWNRKWNPADGLVDPGDDGLTVLGAHRLRERAYSPTALQRYAACPYRFYLHAVLGLRPRDRPERLEQMDPLTRGGLFHEVQFELLVELRRSHRLPMAERDLGDLYRLADLTLDAVAERWREEVAPAIPRVWHSEVERLRIDLRGWIRAVVEAGERWRPERFELAFGLPKDDRHDPASSEAEAEIAGGRRLRGSIDLVEADTGGNALDALRGKAQPPPLRVTDHKTGRPPRGRGRLLVGGGEILQPLLYAAAAESVLDRTVTSGRLFFCTRRGDYSALEVPVDDEARAAVEEVLAAVDGAVGGGFLPAAPRPDACARCDFRPVCGPHEEARARRKRPDRLAPLERIRSFP
ncbi:MAG: PD-(D/E)XK nuclease family protein, partial [Acidobacteriota bacterium]